MRALLTVLTLSLIGCGTARRGEPFAPPPVLDGKEERGQVLFFRHCSQCHPEGEGGLGPALNNKPLPPFAIRTQVRTGVGAMPSFSKAHLSDEELDAIVAFMLALR